MTFKEIGEMFNVGAERIWQIESEAIRLLRYPDKSNDLKHLL
jgi:DNA-directed RNA polymerase sigma subunit (sigma70/sigma32)